MNSLDTARNTTDTFDQLQVQVKQYMYSQSF